MCIEHSTVSILIPAYNAAATVGETLQSAISQTWPHKEIILVDDGSTDDTREVARRRGVLVAEQHNQGAAAARNRAFDLSRGDYIQYLDADDILAPDKIERQVKALAGCGPRTLGSGPFGTFFKRTDCAVFTPTALWTDLSPAEWLIRKLQQNAYIQTAAWLTPRALVEEAGPWNTKMLSDDDGEFFCRVIRCADSIKFFSGAASYYRRSSGLSYIGRSEEKIRALWESMKLHVAILRSLDDSERARKACLTYLQAAIDWVFYPEWTEIIHQAHALAGELGGSLTASKLSWKYCWLEPLFGTITAKRAEVFAQRVRAHALNLLRA
jgi:glycosyltransferase involved in cell wall biosynthesis